MDNRKDLVILNSPSSNGSNGSNGQLRPLPRPKWTIMVYLAGDNNLSASCISVLQGLESVVSGDDVRVLACYDSNTPAPKGSRYLDMHQRRRRVDNGFNWGLHDDLIPLNERNQSIDSPDFCDSTTDILSNDKKSWRQPDALAGFTRFMKWAMEMTPQGSENYMLIVFGHGPVVASQTFLAKENPQSSVLLGDLGNVLGEHFGPERGRMLDIFACNNCFMNGIETAYEVKDLADFMIGSQGLMLAAGWPYQKIISEVAANPNAEPEEVAGKMLKACARNLLDFSLMDRSSEQAVCDLRKLREKDNLIEAVQHLSVALQKGLAFTGKGGKQVLAYPAIADAVKLARLEAQAYWNETFVDLYDFCERLLKKCNETLKIHTDFLKQLGLEKKCSANKLGNSRLVVHLKRIARCCIKIQKKIRLMVPRTNSYYIGPDLQYSHGLSIYFPWTRPEGPYSFFNSGRKVILTTAFATYKKYDFAAASYWSDFLAQFFRATLRKVRRGERKFTPYSNSELMDHGLIREIPDAPQSAMLAIDLQKSSSDTGTEPEVRIKNYPRRNYLSPSDCWRKVLTARRLTPAIAAKEPAAKRVPFPTIEDPPVSYLGWNIPKVLAEVVNPTLAQSVSHNGKRSVSHNGKRSVSRNGKHPKTVRATARATATAKA